MSATINREAFEPFFDANRASDFLSLPRRRILELARAGKLPGHSVGNGARRIWRFRLSELAAAVGGNVFTSLADPFIRTKPTVARRVHERIK